MDMQLPHGVKRVMAWNLYWVIENDYGQSMDVRRTSEHFSALASQCCEAQAVPPNKF